MPKKITIIGSVVTRGMGGVHSLDLETDHAVAMTRTDFSNSPVVCQFIVLPIGLPEGVETLQGYIDVMRGRLDKLEKELAKSCR